MKRKLLTVLAAVMTVSMMLTACGTKDVSKMEDSELYAYLMEMDEDERDAFISGLEDNTDKYRAYQVLLIGQIGEAEVEDDFETTLNISDSDYYKNKKENSNYDTSDIPSTEIVGELEATKEPTWSNGFEFERSDKWDSIEYGLDDKVLSDGTTITSFAIQIGDFFITNETTWDNLIAMVDETEKYSYNEYTDIITVYSNEEGTCLDVYFRKNSNGEKTAYSVESSGMIDINCAAVRILDGTIVTDILYMSEEDAREYFETFASERGLTVVDTEDKYGHGFALQVPGCDNFLIELFYTDLGRTYLTSAWFYTGDFGE